MYAIFHCTIIEGYDVLFLPTALHNVFFIYIFFLQATGVGELINEKFSPTPNAQHVPQLLACLCVLGKRFCLVQTQSLSANLFWELWT